MCARRGVAMMTFILCWALALADADLQRSTTSLEAEKHHKPRPQRVILIRHGEKDGGDDLSARGRERALCLVRHFAGWNITHLFAYTDHPSKRSVETILPLSKSLNVPIDTRAGRDDTDDLVDNISALDENATALVCWEHDALHDVAKHLGVHHAPDYPSDEFDLQWVVRDGELLAGKEQC